MIFFDNLLFIFIKQGDFFKRNYIFIILVEFYVSLSTTTKNCYPDLRFLKWIRIRPNDPTGSGS